MEDYDKMNNLVQTNNTAAPVPMEDNTAAISTVNVDQALAEWNAYQEITEKMLDETDYQVIKEKKYKKKSAWRKYARAFNINTEIISEDIVKTEKTGAVKEATFVVRATLPNGRYADGWGNCSRGERGFAHPNHDIPATAMTRAQNRAIADLIGAGEVTADEIQAENTFQAKQNAKAKLAKKPEPKKEEAEIVEAEVIETKAETVNGFETADNLEPSDAKPVIENYAKTVAKQVISRGHKPTKRTMKMKAEGMAKRKEIPPEYLEELLSFIELNCPGDN